jgi:7-cyano-7-deazaguanine synthase
MRISTGREKPENVTSGMATGLEGSRCGSVLCLASGGLDSTVVMAALARRGHRCTALFIDYGQRAAQAERSAVAAVTKVLGVNLLRRRIRLWSPQRNALLLGRRTKRDSLRGWTSSFLLHRNLTLLIQADIIAAETNTEMVAIGICSSSDYPDCSRNFVAIAESALRLSARSRRAILAPLVTLDKHRIGALAADLGVPVEKTHSCHSGDVPCDECDGCRGRALALGSLK